MGMTLRRLVGLQAHGLLSTGGHSAVGRWIHDVMPTQVVGFGCPEGCMSYLTCPRCRLTIGIRAPYLTMRNCPRCLGRAGLPTPMYVSPRPHAVASGPVEPEPARGGGLSPMR